MHDHTVDPFTPPKRFWPSILNALLATALFRCYHIIFFFTAWSTCVTLINQQKIYALNFQPTLLTVIGTVIGFVISYRTTSSFERYNEGRRLWSQIILQTRTFARTVWFHVPDSPPGDETHQNTENLRARTLIEKKTVVNLIEGFAVSVKHYLRGEEGCYYEDLWPLVKFLPAYALPAALPSPGLPPLDPGLDGDMDEKQDLRMEENGGLHDPNPTLSPSSRKAASAPHLPLHTHTPSSRVKKRPSNATVPLPLSPLRPPPPRRTQHTFLAPPPLETRIHPYPSDPSLPPLSDPPLLPHRLPPQFSYFDVFPFSLLVRLLTHRGKELKGHKAARLRAKARVKTRTKIVTHNVPLEITLYLSSYIAALQRRKAIDVPTTNLLLASLNGLVDALTGLERILTTPIPFSYSIHLWTVTTIYCIALPLQIWKTMEWLTIPATSILSFIFFGFLVAGEEIENPFGYDKNDLNMDHFTHSIIRPELMAITSLPTPDPADWAFSPLNDAVFGDGTLGSRGGVGDNYDVRSPGKTSTGTGRLIPVERSTPDEWVGRGAGAMREALATGVERIGVSGGY